MGIWFECFCQEQEEEDSDKFPSHSIAVYVDVSSRATTTVEKCFSSLVVKMEKHSSAKVNVESKTWTSFQKFTAIFT